MRIRVFVSSVMCEVTGGIVRLLLRKYFFQPSIGGEYEKGAGPRLEKRFPRKQYIDVNGFNNAGIRIYTRAPARASINFHRAKEY